MINILRHRYIILQIIFINSLKNIAGVIVADFIEGWMLP